MLKSDFAPSPPSAADSPVTLPADYYLTHFLAVIAAAETRHRSLLSEGERHYLDVLARLSRPALMLYARLVNRKGPCFRLDKITYPEIGDPHEALGQLLAAGLLVSCGEDSRFAEIDDRFYTCFTHKELAADLKRFSPRHSSKPQLLEWLKRWEGHPNWIASFQKRHPVVRIPPDDPWAFLRFLFFGELRDNLSDFVVRELGLSAPETIPAAALQAHFASRREACDAFRMASLYEDFRALRRQNTAAEIHAWWLSQGIHRSALQGGEACFDRLIDRLGRLLERAGDDAAAAQLYATSPVPPARERLVRLLAKSGNTEDALALLATMRTVPCHEAERFTAEQLLQKLTKTSKRSAPRHHQQTSETLVLPYPEGAVEQAVLDYYRTLGWEGLHSENWLWNAAFGLLFWDIVYDPSYGGFHSPLQFAPSDLYQPGFYTRREVAIEGRLSELTCARYALELAETHWQEKCGLTNPFVSWHSDLPAVMEIFLKRVPGGGRVAVLRRLAKDIRRHRTGFPDLFLWREDQYRFCEIKAENDHLSPHQYQWLRFMEENGIAVSLENIKRPASPCPDAASAHPESTGDACTVAEKLPS